MADRTPVRHGHSFISFQSFYGERLLQQGTQPFFGSWRAPMFASAHTDVVQGQNNGKHLAMSPKSLLQPLDQVLLSAEEKLKKQSLALKQVSTSKALEELMGFQTQARLEKEKMEAKIHEMEEDFKKEKTTWSDLSCQRLEEISSLGTELSDAQSHIDHLKEENAKLTMKDDSTSEAFKELMGLQTQGKMEKEEMVVKVNQMEEDFKKEKTTWSDLSCQRLEEISSLGTELSDAQSHIDHLKEENAKLTMKDDSTSEAFKELMGLQTQGKMEKEEMVVKVNQMEEDFNKEKATWSDLSCQLLEEISGLGTELLDAQSHIDHLKEENAKLTIKDDSTSEAFKELMGLQTQAEMEKEEMVAKVNDIEEDFNREKTILRTELSDAQSHIDHLKEENAKLTMKDDSTSEAFKELMGLQTQGKMEKEEMVVKVNQMEEDFNKEKATWSDLSCKLLEEISGLGTELLDAQSHINHLKEENAELTMKDDNNSEDLEELMGLQTQAKMEKEEMEAKVNQMEEDFNKEKTTWSDLSCQRLEEISSLGTELSDAQSHIDHLKEENAKLTMKDDSTSEDLEELRGLQTQAKMEKEEMDAKINQMEEEFIKEKITWSDLSEEMYSLRTELLVAQSHINHLTEENAELTMKDDNNSEDLEELMGLQTQAKMEKEEMEAKVNQMEEDFNKEKTTWSDLSCQRLEEISSLGTELSDAQSHIDHLKEENAKLTMKDDSTSEAFKELMGLQTQGKMEKEEMVVKVNQMEEDFNKEKATWSDLSCQLLEEISGLGTELLDAQSHIDHLKEENAKLTMKDDSTSEAFKELMGLQTLAKTEMEAKVNQKEEDFNKEKTTWSDLSCQRLEEISSLGTELSDAQSHIDHLKEENAKLTIKDDSTSEDLKELMGLQTQANEEKEEMEAKINQMEEDFNKEKTTWSDLSCQRLEEISSLGTELSDAQSHIDHLKEENAKLTIKDDSTSEAFEELKGLQTQAKMEKEEMEAKINDIEEDFKKEKTSLRMELSDAQSHIDHLKLEIAKLTIKDDSTSEDLKELMGLQTQANEEKEEMEAKINEMEEDFNKEKTTWSDLSCQRLEEISSLGTELSDAQSHIDHLKEENAKLTIKDDSTSEAFEELKGLQTQAKMEKEEMEAKINDIEEDFKKEKTSLRMELSVVQSHIDHLKEENAKLTIKDDSTSEDLKELMGLQTQAKMEKEEMEAKINQMEEDFNKEKTTWSDLSCQRLEEISSLGTELSDAQSHIDHLKEENAKLTMKDDSTSEDLEELMGLQTQAKMEKEEMDAKINQMEEEFIKEKITWSDLSEEISSLGTELSDAQSHIDHLKEENAKLTIKDDSTSEAFEELMDLQTQANEEKEEMEAKINEMEEDFKKEKTTWSDLSCQRLEEISSLGTELSVAQSHIDHLKEENVKLTIKDDSTSEAFEELMGLQTQAKMEKEEMEAKINDIEEDFKKEKTSLRMELSVVQSHIDHLKEENAKLTIKDDSTSEDLKELMGLQTQAKMEKEEMEAKINQMEEDFNKEKTTWSDLSCQRLEEISSLGTELSDAQSHIDHLKEENAKLTIKDDSTSEAFEELMDLQTQADEEKEEMEAKINEMEEDFKKEKTTWSDLSCQRLEEISSLGTELSVAQSHIDHLKEENVKLTIKDDSTSEAFEELMGLQTQAKMEKEEMEAKINDIEEDFKKEKTSLRMELSVVQSHIDHLKEENAKLMIKDDSTSEDLKELMGLQTQAKMEKEEMEAKINQMEEDFNKEKTTWSDLSCQRLEEISSLGTELSDAQSHIDHLKEENAKLTIKDDSTSEAFEELMDLQTQANEEKEEMEAKINEMEEDFKKEKTTWSDLSCQRLEEISSLGTELSVSQSHIDHLKEENVKLTIKDDSTSEAFEELMGLQTQAKMEKEEMEAKINDIEEDFKKEKTSLRMELSDAQSHIDHLKEEKAKLTIKDDSTSEAFEELMGLQTQAKMEKEEMEAKINEMEEDFNKEKTTWSELSCQRLGEISSLGTELSDAQSHIDHLNEENAKLTMKEDSTSESLEELLGLQTQAKTEKEEMESKINEIEEDLKKEKTSSRTELSDAHSNIDHLKEELLDSRRQAEREITSLQESFSIQIQESSARISATVVHWREVIRGTEEEAATTLRESKEAWQGRFKQLEENIESKGGLISSLIDKMRASADSHRQTLNLLSRTRSELCESQKSVESKHEALEETYQTELTEKENSCQRRVAEMVSRNELERLLLQKEAEGMRRTSALEEEIQRLIREKRQLQMLPKKLKKKWWKRRLHLRRRLHRVTASTSRDGLRASF